MLKSYLSLAVRHLFRNRFYALLNIVGLGIGVGCLIVAVLYFDYHLQYDAGHVNEDRIYRVLRHVEDAKGLRYDANTHAVAPHLLDAIPEIEEAARVMNRPMSIMVEGEGYAEKVAVADTSFVRIFTIPMAEGDAQTGLLEKGSCFVTESFARKVFGDRSPIGETIAVSYKWYEGDLTITGVMKDMAPRTDFMLKYSVLTATYRDRIGWKQRLWDTWPTRHNAVPLRTYLLLREGADLEAFRQKLYQFSVQHPTPDFDREVDYVVQPFKEAHLYSIRDYGIGGGEDINRCLGIVGIGVLVLLLACLNYVNLVTAQAPVRAREVGLRKVSGALRKHLIGQFLGESVLLATIAFGVAVGLTWICLPTIADILGVHLAFREVSVSVLLGLPLLVIPLIGVSAGFYPAFVLSRHPPVKTVQGGHTGGRRSWLRTGLVVFQFAASGILIAGTLVVHQQIEYVMNKDLGYHTDSMVMMPMMLRSTDRGKMMKQIETIRGELRAVPGVASVCGIFLRPGRISTVDVRDVAPEGSVEIHRLNYMGADHEFLDTFEIELAAGVMTNRINNFERINDNEGVGAVLINERAAEVLGWETAENAIGKRFYQDFRDGPRRFRMWRRVVGVVKDYHNRPLHSGIAPMVIEIPGTVKYMVARLGPGNLQASLDGLRDVWERFLPGVPFEYEFVDEVVLERYWNEQQLREVLGFFATLSIIVGCLGVLGLVTYTAQQRTKELGIRKVLGASDTGLLMLLSSRFLKLAAVSFVIAWPIAYTFGDDWLANFAYRIDIGASPFLISAGLTLILLAITVGIQAWRSARADPVESLRQE